MKKELLASMGSPERFREMLGNCLGCNEQELKGISTRDTASVLLPIQWEKAFPQGPVILLNKRSESVRQPGDLCCPGGRVDKFMDSFLGTLMRIPLWPLPRSAAWHRCAKSMSHETKKALSVFWAACLRESWEEMGLLPWKVEFLGVLPLCSLRLFQRRILPVAGWIHGQTRFRPNWEVERIIPIPFQDLLNPSNYAAYRIRNHPRTGENIFPAYVHRHGGKKEVLWGATYRIVESFLEFALDFKPPPMESRPLVEGELAQNYLTGRKVAAVGNRNKGLLS